jgi:hypothetical protein
VSADEADGGWLSVDVDRIVPALPFLPSVGETVLSPGDGILTKVKKVTRVLDTDRYVVTGKAIGRPRPSPRSKAHNHSDATAWMFRLVEQERHSAPRLSLVTTDKE